MACTCIPLVYVPLKTSKQSLFGQGYQYRKSKHSTYCFRTRASLDSNNEVCTSPITEVQVVRRPAVNFHPSVWDADMVGFSPCYSKLEKWTEGRIQELKKHVQGKLSSTASDPYEGLILVEAVQRLGIGYHFEAEIENDLHHIHDHKAHEYEDLYFVALRFRLLRQAGYYVSPGVFEKFKDNKGDFHASLTFDVKGMLSLYEAGYLSCKGEYILDEAIAFTSQHLKVRVTSLNGPLRSLVERALDLPLHKRFPRVEARHYISVYEEDESKDKHVLELAKLDYNFLQLLHREELSEVSRWWKAIDVVPKLPFLMRERLVEGYAMVQMIFPEPKHSVGRIYLAKLFALLTVLDDTFDVYGTLEELQPLTHAILRWDVENIEELPEFLKITVVELLNLFNEVGEEMTKRGQPYSIAYFKDQMQNYVRHLLYEAKLFNKKEVPTLEEWVRIASTTVGGPILMIGAVVDMWEHATKEVMDWVVSSPKILKTCSRICRFADDVQTFGPEHERGNLISSVSCYMKEHGVQEKVAIEEIRLMMQEGWKEMNKETLRPTTVPMPILTIVLNLARMAEVLYLYEDGYSYSEGHTKEIVDWLLVTPVPL